MEFTEEQVQAMADRYMSLEPKDKELIRKFVHNSREAKLLTLILGPEVMKIMARIGMPKNGLAAPK